MLKSKLALPGIDAQLNDRVSHGSQEEFAIRLYRRENQVSSLILERWRADIQSGFCKAFSDEPEMFAHGMSPLKDMLVNLNMTNVMIWPR
jgi:DNA excision repair protein ERCC-4